MRVKEKIAARERREKRKRKDTAPLTEITAADGGGAQGGGLEAKEEARASLRWKRMRRRHRKARTRSQSRRKARKGVVS